MSSAAASVSTLREVLPEASEAQLQQLLRTTQSLEQAVTLYFRQQEQAAQRSSIPHTKPTQPSAEIAIEVDDDDDDEADGEQNADGEGASVSGDEEHIEAEDDVTEEGSSHLPTPSSPQHASSTSSSPFASPRKARGKKAPAQSKKRKAGAGSGGGSGSGGKRRREEQRRPKDQRSIASFFGGGSQAKAAVHIPPFPTSVLDTLAPPTGRTIGAFTSPSSSSSPPPAPLTAAPIKPEPDDDPSPLTQSARPNHPYHPPSSLSSSSSSSSSFSPSSSSPSPSSSPFPTPSPSFTSVPPLTLAAGPPCWSPPSPVPYLHLARTFRALEAETGRILKTDLLTLTLWRILDLSPLDLLPSTFLSLNHLAPPFENLQLHIGGAVVSRAIRETTGRSRQQMGEDFVRLGDLGDVAQLYRVRQPMLVRPGELSVREVYGKIYGLSRMTGSGVGKKKEEVVKKLLIACREYETTYIVRQVLQDMRIGGAVTTVLAALAKAVVLHAHYTSKGVSREHGTVATWERVQHTTSKDASSPLLSHAETVPSMLSHPAIAALPTTSLHALIRVATASLRHCYSQHPNLRSIVSHILSHPLAIYTLLSHVHLEAGTPCKPMLGKISKGLHDMLRRLRGHAFSCEIKYDGLRAQVHLMRSGEYRLFSRHLMEQTERWRDLWPLLDRARQKGVDKGRDEEGKERVEVTSFILDAELVGVEVVHADDGSVQSFRILPFQAVTTRKRKVDGKAVDAQRVEVQVMVYAFDLILLNDQPLLQKPLQERRALMRAHFVEVPAGVQFVEHVDVSREESAAIAVQEEDDDAEDANVKQIAAVKKGRQKEDEADADEGESGSEGEAVDAVPAESASEEDRLFQKATARGRAASPQLEEDEEVSALEPASKAVVVKAVKGATAGVESLSDEAVEMGAAAYSRVLRFLHDVAIVRGEGLMAKSLSPLSTYEPDIRTDTWCKLKRDYVAGLSVGDSLDVVPIGGWWGNGRKAGWYSPVLLAVYNPDSECLESFCKCMSGFTDVEYAELVRSFAPRVIPRPKPYYVVDEQLTPTVWFDADRVWEVRGADLTISPKHSAAKGLVDDAKGISLRFPRFIRVREDKAVEDATSSQQIAELYRMQTRKGNGAVRGKR